MDLFEKNLGLLRTIDPALAGRVGKFPFPEEITVVRSKSGEPVPQIQSIYLHSNYEPTLEAQKLIADFQPKPGNHAVIYGLGFGYHILEWLKARAGDIIVVEPLMSVFRAFLSSIDLEPFLPRARFLIDEPPPKIIARQATENWEVFVHRPSLRFSQDYFQTLEKSLAADEYLSKHRLKVMVINPIYGGSLPTAGFCAKALENLGHSVVTVHSEDFADSFAAIQEITRNKQNAGILSNCFMNMMQEVILAKAADFRPDMILALAQAPLSKDGIARLKSLKIPIAFWFVEDFRTLTYWKDIANAYDYFFTIQQDEFFKELKHRLVKNHYYLPQACSPDIHKPLRLDKNDADKFSADLSFMGAAYYNRIHAFPRLLEFDFKIWGTGWDLGSAVGRKAQNDNKRVSTEDCVKIYNAAAINLNLHSSTFHEDVNPNGDFVNPRTFEIAACSGFQLVDERSELAELFRAGDEVAVFKTIEELKDKIRHYLKHEDERKAIAAKGRERALREHTFEHRMREMLVFIYKDRLADLQKRLDTRLEGVDCLIEQAGSETELGKYLKQFKNVGDFSMKTITDRIAEGEAALSKNELLLLMVDQVVKEAD